MFLQVSVYNFAWEDMTTPSMALLTDIVRVAVSCVQTGGKDIDCVYSGKREPTSSFDTLRFLDVDARSCGFAQIAVHCHAGYGRTGLVIASVIVMMKNLPPQQAVALVRDKRPTSVQTSAQVRME
ncbi:unnamed protein product [Hapterophycus canaliculatus]